MADKARPGAVAGGRVPERRVGRQPTQSNPKPTPRSVQRRSVHDGQDDLFVVPHALEAKLDGRLPPSSPPRPPSSPPAGFGAMPRDPITSKATHSERHSPQFEAWVHSARSRRIEDVTRRRGIRLNGKNERCGPCPVCGGDDRFSINIKKQVWNCRGCDRGGDVIDLVQHLDGCDFLSACKALTGEPPPRAARAKLGGPNGKDHAARKKVVVARFDYTDLDGTLLFQVERIEFRNPDGSFVVFNGKRKKTFRQRRPDPKRPSKWLWNVDGAPLVPYRLAEVIEHVAMGHVIHIVEGEGKVDLLRRWNIPATCCAGGAGKWRAEHSMFLKGADIVILPDNDEAGRRHVDTVGASLRGIVASVRVLELPGLQPTGDIRDWEKAGHTADELWRLTETDARPWMPRDKVDAAPGMRGERPSQPESDPDGTFTDDALALAFADTFEKSLRFVAVLGRWFIWDKTRWEREETLLARDYSRSICRSASRQCDHLKTSKLLASAKTVSAVERLAQADRRLAATVDQWDADTDLFNTPYEEIE
jgi:putative DNA primase/helicase